MIRIIYKAITLTSLLMFLSVIPAFAAIPVPLEVTEDIVEPERTELGAQRAELLIRRDGIKLNVAIHNAKCSKVSQSSSIVDECRANQGKLRSEITIYAADVNAFNSLVLNTPKVMDTPDPTKMHSKRMIKYFLINRAENYTLHRAIMSEMIDDATSEKKWPGPTKEYDRLANPLDESQKQWDKELLRPLDHKKIKEITLDQTAHIVNVRQDAREREASRRASDRMHKAMRQLEEKWGLRPGQSFTAMEKNNPEFRKELNDILSEITRDEIADVHKARRLALKEMEEIMVARAVAPARKQKFYETKQGIYARRDSALSKINSQSLKDMSNEMYRLKQEGYYRDGDNLVEKDRNDPQFREAVNEAVRNVLIRQYGSEQLVQQKAFNEMRSAVKEMIGK